MNKKLLIAFLVVSFFLIYFMQLVSANKYIDYVKESRSYVWLSEKSGKGYDFLISETAANDKFGFYYLLLGLVSGLILWTTYKLIQISRGLKDGFNPSVLVGRDKADLKESRTRWLALIAGSFWKIFAIGILFWTLMHIPLISRIIQFIILETLIEKTGLDYGFFTKALVLAFEIGYLPAIFEAYRKSRITTKLEARAMRAKAGTDLEEMRGKPDNSN